MKYRKLSGFVATGLCCTILLTLTSFAQQPWPDLTTLKNYPAANGTNECWIYGNGTETTEKGKSNALKNRFRLPPQGFQPVQLADFLALSPGPSGAAPTSGEPRNGNAVSVVGYVREVKPGGFEFGESCNCGAKKKTACDAHIEIVLDPHNTDTAGHGMMVVEVTERSRRLASLALLQTNVGNDWSTPVLRAQLLGRWVRFYGWQFYDPNHHKQAWNVDPADGQDGANWRQTCWEVHPVMGIEKLQGPPGGFAHILAPLHGAGTPARANIHAAGPDD